MVQSTRCALAVGRITTGLVFGVMALGLASDRPSASASGVPAKRVRPAAHGWVQVKGQDFVVEGKPIRLRGIGLGNWMLIESFMIGLPQVDYVMRQTFEEVLGPEKAAAFWNAYMESYYTETDIARIRQMGFNHVRLPFSYRHFESDTRPGRWREQGFRLIDRIIGWCRKHGLWVLLDLHSAPGCQAADWNAESAHGEVFFWDDADYQARVVALWREIARRYRNEPTVLGYELVNEPDTTSPAQVARMNAFYRQCIRAIRQVDKRHIIIVHGDRHATDMGSLEEATLADPQVVAAFHFYHQYTPPLGEIEEFPTVHNGQVIDEDFLVHRTGLAARAMHPRINRPKFLGEFGIHYGARNLNAQRKILETVISWCERNNVSWNLWHWKDVRGMGLWRMREGAPWLKLLAQLDAPHLNRETDAAIRAYVNQVNQFMPLGENDRVWLARETRRDLERLVLRRLVEKMRDLSPDELAALGRSFHSENFERDEPMALALERLLKQEPQRARP